MKVHSETSSIRVLLPETDPLTDPWTRRAVMGAALGRVAGALVSNSSSNAETRSTSERSGADRERLPSLFLAHGAPPLLDDAAWVAELGQWAGSLPVPRSILMVSAHWEERPATLGATRTVPLIYDFGGFPTRYYQQKYASPGAPHLAKRIRELLSGSHVVADDPDRGLDHGAYVPLVAMYPAADVPVLQMSLPSEHPQELYSLGRALRPLRDEGVLIIGSGFITHNLRTVNWGPPAPPPAWAIEFDAWAADAIARNDVDALLDYQKKGPGAEIALPTREHFVPLLVSLGAANDRDSVNFPISGFWMGSLTRRSVQFG